MQTRCIWKLVCQFKRVLDGTLGQRAVLESKHLPVVGFVELVVASAGAAFPESAEAAIGRRPGAVDEDHNGLGGVQLPDRLQIRCARNSATIEPRSGPAPSFYLAAHDVGDIARAIDAAAFEPF